MQSSLLLLHIFIFSFSTSFHRITRGSRKLILSRLKAVEFSEISDIMLSNEIPDKFKVVMVKSLFDLKDASAQLVAAQKDTELVAAQKDTVAAQKDTQLAEKDLQIGKYSRR